MEIYNSSGYKVVDVEVDDNSYRYRAILEVSQLVLYYSLAEHVELEVGSYCKYQGVTFTLRRPQDFKMKHSRLFEYTVTFETDEANAKIWKLRNTVDGRLKFSYTAKPVEHLQLFVDNMNRRDSGWTVGDCIDGTETLISYDHAYCWDALTQMADEFETEFEITSDKVVSLKKVEYNKSNPLALSYGKGNGFKPDVGRANASDSPPVEILYAQGGTDNIDLSKYGSQYLLLPKSQTLAFDGAYFEDEEGFDENNARGYVSDGDGLSIRRSDKDLSSLAEDSLDCSEIYPKRVGTVTAVECEDEDKHYWNFYDTDIPEALDYEDCLIDGETMTVIFQSGMLSGREFEVAYDHDTRKFEIVPQEIDGVTMPDADTGYIPAAGDTYAVFNVYMPDAYICDDDTKSGASWDMFRECVRYLYENEDEQYTLTGELDGIWAKKDWTNISGRIVLGGYVKFTDERFASDGMLVRITGIKDYVNKPHSPAIELSNAIVTSGVSSTLKQMSAQEVLIEETKQSAIQYTKRRFRDAKETITMLEEALLDNFTESITPIAVQTMSLLVGDESLQFRFVDNTSNPTAVDHTITCDSNAKELSSEAGIIQHLTLGISDISSSHDASEYMYWEMSEYSSGYLDDADARYYFYAKVSKTKGTGEFLLSETAIAMEGVDGYYHLLVGILNSEYDGERSFVTLYGFTEILPGRITTDRIVSSDGGSYFDMVNNAMKLSDKLTFNTGGDGLLRLQGTLVQSQSGAESYVGCYRGVYNSSYTYFNGDEVTFTVNGLTSTYRYISDTPGHAMPTNTTYWQVIAEGSKGDDGADGTSVTIKGSVDDESELPTTGNTNGDGYLIDGYLYVWDGSAWNNVGQIKGDKGDTGEAGADGADADYYEIRYAVNGSTTTAPSLDTTSRSPSGWSTTMPKVVSLTGAYYYLWMTIAKISADGTSLVQQWSTPVRITPYDGVDGTDGSSPVMVYRGVYSSSETYYGNSNRLDCVKYNGTYYIARIDAGTFSGYAPTNTTYWNSFGASFESVATNLLLAEGANIGDWYISDGKIVSTLSSGDIIELDASNNVIKITSSTSGGTYSQETSLGSVIKLDASSGVIEARASSSSSYVSYMSPTGIFANRAGTQCVSATTGYTQRAAICALGYGSLAKSTWSAYADCNLIAGLYGYASNSSTAPSYGGYIYDLKVKGLTLNIKYITSTLSATYLTDAASLVVGFTSSQATVYLPAATREGQTILFKQWWSGSMRVYPRSGQVMYDDTSENDYYDVKTGYELVAHFVKASLDGEAVEVWLVSRFKF